MTDCSTLYAKSTPQCRRRRLPPALAPRSNIATKCWRSAADADRKNSLTERGRNLVQPLRLRHNGRRPMLDRFRRCLLRANASDQGGSEAPSRVGASIRLQLLCRQGGRSLLLLVFSRFGTCARPPFKTGRRALFWSGKAGAHGGALFLTVGTPGLMEEQEAFQRAVQGHRSRPLQKYQLLSGGRELARFSQTGDRTVWR